MSSVVLLFAFLAPAEGPALEEILARLAANQERAIEARASVVYRQQIRSRLFRGGGKLAREEWREYTVTPTPEGTNKQRVSFKGQYEKGGELHSYESPGFRHKDLDLDGELLESLTDSLVNEKKARDGLSIDLFPLTRAEQRHYRFKLEGARKVMGQEAYIVSFQPRKDQQDRPWSGEVLVHASGFQPLAVTTKLGKGIPAWARVVFGVNLRQVGFSVTYREVAPGLWFPATYGSEFFLRLFFGYARTITLSMENSDFRFARADSTITYDLAGLRPERLRTEWLENPEGLGTARPRFSWIVTSPAQNQRQTAYRILVAGSRETLEDGAATLWDSGRVASRETLSIEYRGAALGSGAQAWWKVMVWDAEGRASAWSEPARFSIGLLKPEDWTAAWISHRDDTPLPAARGALHLPAPRCYRGVFQLEQRPRRATLHVTALGLADPYFNGRRVTDAMFLPGWSDYRRRVYSRAFDVTAHAREGENVLGAIVADGWYSGYVGYGLLAGYGPNKLGRFIYGKTPALRMQLELEFADGRRETIGTSPRWRAATGPVQEADLLMGETYDARRELAGWAEAGFDDAHWESAIAASLLPRLKAAFFDAAGEREVDLGFHAPPVIQPYPGPPVRAVAEIRPVAFREQAPGVWIFDLGQNISGVVRLMTKGPAGTRVRLRFGEMLHPDGRLMTENLRRARATDTYILKGGGEETWTPRFTYHGFRYVEVSGLPAPPAAETITGIVVHSDTPLVSTFEASDSLLTRLHRNIVWTQRSNFVEIPTDCPQRDERLGWTGDAQIYARAAAFNADTAAFMTKWLDDLAEAQDPIGVFPDYAPYPMTHGPRRVSWGTAWMDAGVIVPWTQWRVYGDTRLLARHYAAISRFLDYRLNRDQKLEGVDEGNDWGDWLSLGERTPLAYIDLAYHAGSLAKGAEIAAAVGRDEDAGRFRDRFAVVRRNFQRLYQNTDCSLKVETQTAHALALQFGLAGEECRPQLAGALARRIEVNGGRMATGFLGAYPLPHVLSGNGHHELAVKLVQSREFPSWGYGIENGATTIWERWDSFTKEKGFQNASMNSFSHYAFGAVGEWMFRRLAGIEPLDPGQGRLRIEPRPGGTLEWVRSSYDSPRGMVKVAWKRGAAGLEVEIELPANVTAEVVLADEDGSPVRTETGSGRWRFVNGRPVSASGG